MLLQPNRQPPAIQTDTLTARISRGNLLNTAQFIAGSLLRFIYVVEKTAAAEKHKTTKALQVLCNGLLVSLVCGEHR